MTSDRRILRALVFVAAPILASCALLAQGPGRASSATEGADEPRETKPQPIIKELLIGGKTVPIKVDPALVESFDQDIDRQSRGDAYLQCYEWEGLRDHRTRDDQYVADVAAAWCDAAPLPDDVSGEGYSVKYQRAKYRERNMRLGTRDAQERPSDVKIRCDEVGIVSFEVSPKGDHGTFGTVFADNSVSVKGSGRYVVILKYEREHLAWRQEIDIPHGVVAVVTAGKSAFKREP